MTNESILLRISSAGMSEFSSMKLLMLLNRTSCCLWRPSTASSVRPAVEQLGNGSVESFFPCQSTIWMSFSSTRSTDKLWQPWNISDISCQIYYSSDRIKFTCIGLNPPKSFFLARKIFAKPCFLHFGSSNFCQSLLNLHGTICALHFGCTLLRNVWEEDCKRA